MARISPSVEACGEKQELCFAAAGLCGVTLYYLMENMALTYTLASNVGGDYFHSAVFYGDFQLLPAQGISREKGFSWAL